MRGGTFKEWPIWCWHCEASFTELGWSYNIPLPCPSCGTPTALNYDEPFDRAPGLITDDIPGGVEIRHGLVDEAGNPRRFYSKTEMKAAANELGLKWADDTPGKPYPVKWSGKVKQSPYAPKD